MMFKVGDTVRKINGTKEYVVTNVKAGWICTNQSRYDNWYHASGYQMVRNNDELRLAMKKFTEQMAQQLGEGWEKDILCDPSDPKFKAVQDKIKDIMRKQHEQHQQEAQKESGENQGEGSGAKEGDAKASEAPQD